MKRFIAKLLVADIEISVFRRVQHLGEACRSTGDRSRSADRRAKLNASFRIVGMIGNVDVVSC
jgi:hypothetical protein